MSGNRICAGFLRLLLSGLRVLRAAAHNVIPGEVFGAAAGAEKEYQCNEHDGYGNDDSHPSPR